MLTVINNTRMQAVTTTEDLDTAKAWAETVPLCCDFSIIGHHAQHLSAYNPIELYQLHRHLTKGINDNIKQGLTKEELVPYVLRALEQQPITSTLPPDAKRVAPLEDEENDMPTKKKATTKKTAAKKAPAKKAATKKDPAAPRAPRVADERKIKVLKSDNPHREGSKRAASFDLLGKSNTVQDYKDAGGPIKYIARWEKDGFISLS